MKTISTIVTYPSLNLKSVRFKKMRALLLLFTRLARTELNTQVFITPLVFLKTNKSTIELDTGPQDRSPSSSPSVLF